MHFQRICPLPWFDTTKFIVRIKHSNRQAAIRIDPSFPLSMVAVSAKSGVTSWIDIFAVAVHIETRNNDSEKVTEIETESERLSPIGLLAITALLLLWFGIPSYARLVSGPDHHQQNSLSVSYRTLLLSQKYFYWGC